MRAYSLAIACAQSDLMSDLIHARKKVYSLISNKRYDELDFSGALDFPEPELITEEDITKLREQLAPFLIYWEKLSM